MKKKKGVFRVLGIDKEEENLKIVASVCGTPMVGLWGHPQPPNQTTTTPTEIFSTFSLLRAFSPFPLLDFLSVIVARKNFLFSFSHVLFFSFSSLFSRRYFLDNVFLALYFTLLSQFFSFVP